MKDSNLNSQVVTLWKILKEYRFLKIVLLLLLILGVVRFIGLGFFVPYSFYTPQNIHIYFVVPVMVLLLHKLVRREDPFVPNIPLLIAMATMLHFFSMFYISTITDKDFYSEALKISYFEEGYEYAYNSDDENVLTNCMTMKRTSKDLTKRIFASGCLYELNSHRDYLRYRSDYEVGRRR